MKSEQLKETASRLGFGLVVLSSAAMYAPIDERFKAAGAIISSSVILFPAAEGAVEIVKEQINNLKSKKSI